MPRRGDAGDVGAVAGRAAGAGGRRLERLEALLEHRFASRDLPREALTHPSALGYGRAKARNRRSYERLEFLGDRVLGLIVAHLLHDRFADDAEGALTQRQVVLISRDTLAGVAAGIRLGELLEVARSEDDGRHKPALLADACEAVIGALYLDGGLDAARRFVAHHWHPLIEAMATPPRDAKMELQEWAQGRGMERPTYTVLAAEGPPHALRFKVEASLGGTSSAHGDGHSKRDAERAAAAALLGILKGQAE